MSTVVLGTNLLVADTFAGVGSNVSQTATGNCVIGGSGSSTNGTYNVVVGNSVAMAATSGRCVVIGNGATCNATSTTAATILIGNGAATTQPSVCQLGGRATATFISDYGLGHFYMMAPATYNATVTLSGADVARGFVRFDMSNIRTCYFPTAATIVATMKDAVVGSGYRVFVFNNSATSLTLSLNFTNAGLTHSGVTTLARMRGAHYYLYVTNATVGSQAVLIRSSYNLFR